MSKQDASLSLHAACAVIDAYGFGGNAFQMILVDCKPFVRDGRIMQSDLDRVIQAARIAA